MFATFDPPDLTAEESFYVRYSVYKNQLLRYPLSSYSQARIMLVISYYEDREEYERCAELLSLLEYNKKLFSPCEDNNSNTTISPFSAIC